MLHNQCSLLQCYLELTVFTSFAEVKQEYTAVIAMGSQAADNRVKQMIEGKKLQIYFQFLKN